MKTHSWRKVLVFAFLALTILTCGSTPAWAYTIEGAFREPCHEPITQDALRRVREDFDTTPPIETTSDERALINDVVFSADDDVRDLGAITLVLGNRDQDLKGRSPTDLANLASVHGDPARQDEHCLRHPEFDEPGGSEIAIQACQDSIRANVELALDALDADGIPDPDNRVDLDVYLDFRGAIDAPLPAFYVYMGRALHTLQDGFSHTFRTDDGMTVTVVLDWVEVVEGTADESIDGPPHMIDLDSCTDDDERRTHLHELAIDASTALLAAVLDPSLSRDEKLTQVDDVLATYLSYQAGCTFENNWCDAPENAYRDATGCGCRVASRPGGGAAPLAAGLLITLLGALSWRHRASRNTRRHNQRLSRWVSTLALLFSLVLAQSAFAQEMPPPPGPRSPDLGAYLAAGASFDRPAAAVSLAGRYRISDYWLTGLDAEWNPFFSFETKNRRAGVLNVYATLIRRYAMRSERLWLRTTAHLGTSVLLFDLYGAPKGSTGLYFGLAPLGVEIEINRLIHIVIDPAELAFPIPHVTGVPFGYRQYRFTIGIQFGAG